MTITTDEAYLLGILYGKGEIIAEDNNEISLLFKIKFRRPTNISLRTDNKHSIVDKTQIRESLRTKLLNDFYMITRLLKQEWKMTSDFDLPNSHNDDDWSMKEMLIKTQSFNNKNKRLCELLNVQVLNNKALLKFPYHLNIEKYPDKSLAFIQGVCDSCSLIPNEAPNAYGKNKKGSPRIQLEPSQERWELPVGLCKIFQLGLNIPVNNINWGHPQIRYKWKHQNHQFRISLKCIPPGVDLYRLNYKREEYRNLYNRKSEQYKPTHLCPYAKAIKNGETITLFRENNEDLNSELLDKRLQGISIDIHRKKSMIVCKLLECSQCKDFFNIEIKNK